MKLLYLPLVVNGLIYANEQIYLAKAFSKKFEVEIFDFYNENGHRGNKLLEIVQSFKPDVIHCQFQGTREIDPYILKLIKISYPKTIITQWTGDVRTEPISQMVEYGQYCDITFVCGKSLIKQYQDAGLADVRYWQNAVDKSQIGKLSKNHKGIVFCGGRYTTFPQSQERIDLIERFMKFSDFSVYGMGWETPAKLLDWNKQTELYQKSYLILGHNNVGGIEWWFSDRHIIAMASGRPHLCQYSPKLEELFEDGKECVFWRTIDEAVEKAHWLLKNPKIATEIGIAGQKKVLKEYLWDTRVKEYIKEIKCLL